jgi:hypothetical protein
MNTRLYNIFTTYTPDARITASTTTRSITGLFAEINTIPKPASATNIKIKIIRKI